MKLSEASPNDELEWIKNIENKVSYEDTMDIIKDFYFNTKSTSRKTIKCPDCTNISLRMIEDSFDEKAKTIILTCKNKKCNLFSLFKENIETNLFDCLYYGKYNKLEDVLLENKN